MIGEALGGVQTVLADVNEHGSFGDYVTTLVASKHFAQFWVLLVAGYLGVVANYLWKWATDVIHGSLWKYLVQDHPKNTVLSLMAISGWVLMAMSQIEETTAWGLLINIGLTTGFAVDVLVNKANQANRQQWTPEERAKFKEEMKGHQKKND